LIPVGIHQAVGEVRPFRQGNFHFVAGDLACLQSYQHPLGVDAGDFEAASMEVLGDVGPSR